MSYVLTGIVFVVVAVAALVWQTFRAARDIAGAPERSPVAPESPALAISHGAGDLKGMGLLNDGSTAEPGTRGTRNRTGQNGERS